MNNIEKIIPQSEVLQKSLKLANQHSIALETFARNYPSLKFAHENKSALQLASQSLLATQGINKNILGVQSFFAKNNEWIKQANLMQNEILKPQQPLSRSFQINLPLALELENTMKMIREYTPREIISQRDFLRKISDQTLFVARLQPNIPKIEPLFANIKIIESIFLSRPLIEASLSVAMETLNFSSALDRLPQKEQIKILDYLEGLKIDDETNSLIPDDLPEEIQSDYITLVEFLRNFWKTNENYIIGILTTVETTVKNFSENDFSNPFTVIAFIYNCIAFLFTQFKDDQNKK